jgi:hypothetical protein
MENPDMILGVLDMIKSNPEMLKTMLGDKFPTGWLDDPKKVNIIIGLLKFLFRIYLFVRKIWAFKQYIFGLILAFIIYVFFM